MTNLILSAFATLLLAVSFSYVSDEQEPIIKHHLTEEEKIDIYEQIMSDFVINQN